MMPLPPGCKLGYTIWIDVDRLDEKIIDWYTQVGGIVNYDSLINHRGQEEIIPYVSYGRGKRCHHHNNGHGGSRLWFMGEDASVASMCLLKFSERVTNHNMKEIMDRYEEANG